MKNRLIFAGVLVGVALLVRRCLRAGGCSWERMLERMPDDAPPKWMFRNIAAIREDTERILERLGDVGFRPEGEKPGTAMSSSPIAP